MATWLLHDYYGESSGDEADAELEISAVLYFFFHFAKLRVIYFNCFCVRLCGVFFSVKTMFGFVCFVVNSQPLLFA